MQLQDQIENFQKQIFSHFRTAVNNECMIAALVPLVAESYGIYKFITSMLRAMHSCKFGERVSADLSNTTQLWATMKHWSLYEHDTKVNITVWLSFTTSALTSDTSQV